MEKLKRESGILLHITSLPNKYGLGTFSSEAKKFIDFLKRGGFGVWQVLPFADCGYGLSPYSAISSFAINPYFIDLTEFLSDEEMKSFNFDKNNKELYEEQLKFDKALDCVYKKCIGNFDISKWEKNNEDWINDYALYKVLSKKYSLDWRKFPTPIKNRNKVELNKFQKNNFEEIQKEKFYQYLAEMQWQRIKDYAKQNNIEIFGDIPMYVELNSADVWSNQSDWQLEQGKPKFVAGVPADYFNSEGQLWGYPLYNYENMFKNKYSFWTRRFHRLSKLFDIIRIDHFVAFNRYWAIPNGSQNALSGHWVNGPKSDILSKLVKCSDLKIVAEDLGIVTEDLIKLRCKFDIPGLKILQFAFDSDKDNIYKPHNYEKNCVAYIGTHDNETYMGFLNSVDWDKLNRIKKYMGLPLEVQNDVVIDRTIEVLYRSSAKLVILTMQDILKLDNFARMNIPGIAKGNWLWQLNEFNFGNIADKYKILSDLYAR